MKKQVYLSVLLLLFFLGCPGIGDFYHYPCKGTVLNANGENVHNVKVWASLEGIFSGDISYYDSSSTDNSGEYNLRLGFVKYKEQNDGGCSTDNKKTKLQAFMFVFVHPEYDTTVVGFLPDSTFLSNTYNNIILQSDTIIVQKENDYNEENGIKIIPTITLKNK